MEWKIPAPETCDAIKNAAITAGTLMNRKNWSIESIAVVPKVLQRRTSVRRLHRPLIACEKLVDLGRRGNREQRENRNDGQHS